MRAVRPKRLSTTALRCVSSPISPRRGWPSVACTKSWASWRQAEIDFREALRLQPSFALPHARLATLLRGKLPQPDEAALEERLADRQLDSGPRARLLFARPMCWTLVANTLTPRRALARPMP